LHQDQRYITFLQQNDARGIGEIYRLYADKIKRLIVTNSGSEEDAADIFQESLVDIYRMSTESDFVLTCPFEAFLVLVCKRKWLNVLKKNGRSPVTKSFDDVSSFKQEEWDSAGEYARREERETTIMELLEQLGDKCREIIKACMSGDHQEKVAESLGLTYAYLRKKKSECMAGLAALARQHPLFK
jgi:RNA polymerase sigma factor (sigma-70 family)